MSPVFSDGIPICLPPKGTFPPLHLHPPAGIPPRARRRRPKFASRTSARRRPGGLRSSGLQGPGKRGAMACFGGPARPPRSSGSEGYQSSGGEHHLSCGGRCGTSLGNGPGLGFRGRGRWEKAGCRCAHRAAQRSRSGRWTKGLSERSLRLGPAGSTSGAAAQSQPPRSPAEHPCWSLRSSTGGAAPAPG